MASRAELGKIPRMPVREMPQSRARISIPEILLEGDPPIPHSHGVDESSWTLFLQARSPGSVAVHWDIEPAAFQRFAAGTGDGCVWVRVRVGPESQGTVVYRAVWRESETVLITIPLRHGELRAELGGWSRTGQWRSLSMSETTQSLTLTPVCLVPAPESENSAPVSTVAKNGANPFPTEIAGVVGHSAPMESGDFLEPSCSRQTVTLELFRLVGIANALDPLPAERPVGIVACGLASPWSGCEGRVQAESSS